MSASMLTDEQVLLRQSIRDVAQDFKAGAADVDRERRPPVENLAVLAKLGFTGSFIPPEFGGLGLTTLETALIFEQVAAACPNTAMLLACTDGATPRAILHLGNEEQKRRYLPGFLSGELLAAWAMSEPDAGSDAGACKTRATLDGDHYVINGSKTWVTGAQVSGLFLVIVRLSDEPGLKGCGAILVERDAPGLSFGNHLDLLGLRGTGMTPVYFDACRVPKYNLIVPCGEMSRLLSVLDGERVVGNPSIALGIAQSALEASVAFIRERRQFGKAIADFQGIQWKVADLVIDIEAARALIYRAAERAEANDLASWDASITKVFASEMGIKVTNAAMQLAGASGLSVEYPFERHFRDIRGLAIGYGTSEVHRTTIGRQVVDGRYAV
jgi:alkylation response protein AidB-like acyl-CoA dehydrogenase